MYAYAWLSAKKVCSGVGAGMYTVSGSWGWWCDGGGGVGRRTAVAAAGTPKGWWDL